MKRYLVTGGAGFIGSHLVDALLARGDAVRVLDDLSTGNRANLAAAAELVTGDVLDTALVETCLSDVDGCFHLAAVSSVHGPQQVLERARRVNLKGSTTIFHAAARRTGAGATVPVVYASSAAVYGDALDLPLRESAELAPISAYGADKVAAEQFAQSAWQRASVPSIGLRLFNVYGPRQDPRSSYSGVISIFADRLGAGAPADIYGDGEQVRDFVYVGDAVAFFRAAMDQARAGAHIYNVCSGHGTTVNALYAHLQALLGCDLPATYRPARPGDIRDSIGDPSAAEQRFALRADTPLLEGLRRLVTERQAAQAEHAKALVAPRT